MCQDPFYYSDLLTKAKEVQARQNRLIVKQESTPVLPTIDLVEANKDVRGALKEAKEKREMRLESFEARR